MNTTQKKLQRELQAKEERRLKREEALRKLIEVCPRFAEEKPLELGIYRKLRNRFPQLTGMTITRAVYLYVQQPWYQAYKDTDPSKIPRYDLDGNPI